MDKLELKKQMYKDFSNGLTLGDVKAKYQKEHPRSGMVASGCYQYYLANQHKFKPKTNKYRGESLDKTEQLIKALEILEDFAKEDINHKVNALDFVQQAILHNMEGTFDREDFIAQSEKLWDLRHKRRVIKEEQKTQAVFETALKTMTTPKSIGCAKATLEDRKRKLESLKEEHIVLGYQERLKYVDKRVAKYLAEYREEFGV